VTNGGTLIRLAIPNLVKVLPVRKRGSTFSDVTQCSAWDMAHTHSTPALVWKGNAVSHHSSFSQSKSKLYCDWRSVGQFVFVSGSFWDRWPDFNFFECQFFLLRLRRPLWLEDRSVICSVITYWLESRRACNHTLLSHLRLPQPGGPGPRIYIPQEQRGRVQSQIHSHVMTDGQSVNVPLSSPRGFRESVFEWILIRH
jgi:hypothetical protein